MTTIARRRGARALALAALAGVAVFQAADAQAAPAWIFRSITVPRGDAALDFGLALGRQPAPLPGDPDRTITGTGMNLEIAGGVSPELELGLRIGFRLDDAGQITQADRYARPFDTETYGTRGDRVSNPELRMRWAVARGSSAQLGLELRAYLPFESGSRFGLMFGLPIALRAGAVRLDTGLYVPIIFYDPTTTVVSVPLHVWIQATSSLWLGPLFGLRVISGNGTRSSYNEYPLGFGLGTMLSNAVDLKMWFLFPHINGDEAARTFGAGIGIQVRLE